MKKVLIVGLGNPGKKYEANRHNVGFMMLDKFVEAEGASFSSDKKYSLAQETLGECRAYFLKPLEYMNLSGSAVSLIARKNGIEPGEILVLHDEIDFPFAVVKLKFSGGHAGHNGLRDIIEKLGSRDFHRLRIGVGRPEDKNDVADYVLSNFKPEEKSQLDTVYKQVAELIRQWVKA